MVCKFCGNVIEDNSDFCFICGQKNPKDVKEEAENNDVFSQAPETQEVKETKAEAEVKVSAEVEVPAENAAEITAEVPAYTAPASPDAPVYDATAPIYAQTTPIYAQSAPVYAQQVIIQHVQAPTVTKVKPEKDPSIATKAQKIFATIFSATFLLQFISWIWYKKADKAGYEKKATDLLNCTMIGLCVFMAIVCLVFVSKYML